MVPEPEQQAEATGAPAPQAEPTAEAEVNADASAPADSAAPDSSDDGASDDGTTDDGASDDAASADGAGAEAAGGEGTEPGADGAPKKKRRRRRRKKGGDGAQATDGATQGGEAGAANGAPHNAQRQGHAQPKGGKGQRDKKPRDKSRRSTDRVPFHQGEEVFGKVTAVLDTAVMIDLSGKALAIFDRSEMEADDLVPEVGDRFVARIHNDGGRGGLVVLTRKPLREEETKPKIEAAMKAGEVVNGLITGAIRGGVEVDIGGVRAFAPASGMDLHPASANLVNLVGQVVDFKVLEFNKGGRDVVVTRRPMLEAEAHERRKHALTLLSEGQELEGVVRTVVEWGAFVALPAAENLEGLVHVSEMSHDSHVDINELAKPGDRFQVKIQKIDEKGKIWLSRKALIADPWAEAKQKYRFGSRHAGVVTRLERFGAFVKLDDGIEGLIPIADLSFNRIEHAEEILKLEQALDVVVQNFDHRTRKISLHLAPPPERANEEPQKIVRNGHVKAEVIRGEAAGVIVRLLGITGRAARGFIPAGQTGTQRGTDLRKHFKPGAMLDLKVIDIDPRRGEPKLSIRGFHEDEERRAHTDYRKKLKAEAHFGTLGDLLKARLGGG